MPSDTLRQITGTFRAPDGGVFSNQTLTWFRERRDVSGQGTTTVLDQPFYVTVDNSGTLNFEVMAGRYLVMARLDDVDRYFYVNVPDQEGPFDIATLIVGEALEPHDLTAFDSLVNKARLWASAAEGIEVENGAFSSRHYSIKSGEFAAAAQSASGAAIEAKDTTKLSEQNAAAARDAAFVSADVYADTAAGLSAVAEGGQFQVIEGSEVVRYRHDPGAVAVEVARYPSTMTYSESGAAGLVPQAPNGQSHLNDSWINPRLGQSIRDIFRQPAWSQVFAEKLRQRDLLLRAQAMAKIPYTGTVIYCDPSATGAGDGSTWADAFTSLDAAFAAAVKGDIIRLNSTEAAPFSGQAVDWGGGAKQGIHIQCDKGQNGYTVFDNRLYGTWTDEGAGVFSFEAPYYGHAAYDFKQDDEQGTVTGCDWTRPSYAAHRRTFRRTVEQVAAWYGILAEESAATTSPGAGKYSYTNGRYYINPVGTVTLAEVNAKACVPRYLHVLSVPHMEDSFWSGRLRLIFSPHPGGGSGYGMSLNGEGCTVADVETVCSGYHSVGWAGSSKVGNRMLNLTANGTISQKVSGTSNAYVFFSPSADTENADCWAVGNYSVHYPCLEADGTPIYQNVDYAPNHGLSHGADGNKYAGLRWSNCGQVDFVDQLNRKTGVTFSANGSFITGGGDPTHIDDPDEWDVVCEDGWALGAGATPGNKIDHYNTIFDRDSLGLLPVKNGFLITTTSGGGGNKQYRLRGGKLTTGAIGDDVYIGPTQPGDNMLLENVELVLEDGHFHQDSGLFDAADPFLRMGGCVVKAEAFNTSMLSQSTNAFAAGPAVNFRSLGGNVFDVMGFIQTRGNYPLVPSYERSNQDFIDAVDPDYADVIDAPLTRYSEGPELLTNGDFATGDLTGWVVEDGSVIYEEKSGLDCAKFVTATPAKLTQEFDVNEGDLVQVKFNLVTRSGAAAFYASVRNVADTSSALGFTDFAAMQCAVREYVYRVRASADWHKLRLYKPSSPNGEAHVANVSIKKLTPL